MSRVLLAHADAVTAAELTAALVRDGHEVRTVANGQAAIDRFIQEPADILVLDVGIEGRDALSTAQAIRAMPGGTNARIVLTADADPPDRSLASIGDSIHAFATLVAPDKERLATLVAAAAAKRAHEIDTRVLSAEQSLLQAERTRPPGEWDEETARADVMARVREALRSARESAISDTDGTAEGREVLAIAHAHERASSEIAGSFEDVSFARLLHRMAEQEATGALICAHPPDGRDRTQGSEPTKIVYFRAGVPVHVRSNLVEESLDAMLAHRDRKPSELSPLELSDSLAEQLRKKLFELFGWERGTFRFAPDRTMPSDAADLGMGVAEIAYHGVRDGMDAALVLERLAPSLDLFAVPRPLELVPFVRLHMPRELDEVIAAIDGTRRLGEILESSADTAASAQLVYAMECLEAVRFEDAPPAREPPEQESWGGPTPVEEPDEWLGRTPSEVPPDDPWAFGSTAPVDERSLRMLLDEVAPEYDDPDLGAPSTVPPEIGRTSPGRIPLHTIETDHLPSDFPPPDPMVEASPRETKVLDQRVEAQLDAERCFRRAQSALDRGRPDEAVRALTQASELCPDEGRFLVYLGWAKHAEAADDAFVLSEALDLAERGCRRAPELANGHLLRARLLRAAGREAAAREAFERVLELDPLNEEAAKER